MRKYLLGLFAIVMAIGFSAFNHVKHDKGPNSSKRTLNTYTQWYNTTDNGTKVGARFYNSTAVDKNTVTGSGCDDVDLPVCAVGSNATLTLGADIPDAEGSGNPGNPDD